MAKYNRQLITPYDIITRSDVVMTQIDPVTFTTQQPAGYRADLVGTGAALRWELTYQGNDLPVVAATEKVIRDVIVEYHNNKEQELRASAVAWVKHYTEHPEDKRGTPPQLLESIYKCAARARLHPDDAPTVETKPQSTSTRWQFAPTEDY